MNDLNCRSTSASTPKPSRNRRRAAPSIAPEDSRVKDGRFEISFGKDRIFRNLFRSFKSDLPFICKDEFHVTLLFITRSLARFINGNDSQDERNHSLTSEELNDAILLYRSLANDPIAIRLMYVARNERVIAIRIEILDKTIRFVDVVPHISLGKVSDAQFRESNELVKTVDDMRKQGMQSAGNDAKIYWKELDEKIQISGRIRFQSHSSR